MLKGWQYNSKGEKIRYFNTATGKMLQGYVTNSKGAVRYFRRGTGLLMHGYATDSKGNVQYFQDGEGFRVSGWLEKDGQIRYFDPKTGYMKTGWVTTGTRTLYFNPVKPEGSVGDYGALCSGIQKIDGYYYYFTPAATLQDIRKGLGAMYTKGFVKVGNYYYYFGSDGKARTGWMTLDEKLYYFNAKGQMYRNTTVTIGGQKYQFDSDGAAVPANYTLENGMVKITDYGKVMHLYPAYLEIPGIADGTVDDVTVLAAIADREMGYLGLDGMVGVCMTILNRSLNENTAFPADFRQAIFQYPLQFCESTDGSFTQFEKRILGQGTSAWASESQAKQAAQIALKIFEAYKTDQTPRVVSGFTTKDFDYIGFMTPAAFAVSGANPGKWETYKNCSTFFDCWNVAWGNK